MEYFEIKETTKKTSEIMAECRKRFPVYSWYDEAKLDADFPAPKELTVRRFKKCVEADAENANMSANDKAGRDGITLRERLLMEIQYFDETGKHLDIENWTLCSGSRDSDGFVPYVYWGDSRLGVDWTHPGDRDSGLRSRVAVSSGTLDTYSPCTLPDSLTIEGIIYDKRK